MQTNQVIATHQPCLFLQLGGGTRTSNFARLGVNDCHDVILCSKIVVQAPNSEPVILLQASAARNKKKAGRELPRTRRSQGGVTTCRVGISISPTRSIREGGSDFGQLSGNP